MAKVSNNTLLEEEINGLDERELRKSAGVDHHINKREHKYEYIGKSLKDKASPRVKHVLHGRMPDRQIELGDSPTDKYLVSEREYKKMAKGFRDTPGKGRPYVDREKHHEAKCHNLNQAVNEAKDDIAAGPAADDED